MHGDDRLFLVVEFLRKGEKEEELGEWQNLLKDSLRDPVQGGNVEKDIFD
ncbi:hypothetical protein GCM10010969_21520 [Saccharibacillus kuerlensis]|uniref:Uncharacterized protein n=1 Tax=Saccharibacillus kuerlensis TaxID=459527 RepID=A0ABQ2L2U5_9BACL|nr:hypothetical protein GCM10010969_21520 [Saccharibacillus kuerlensis]